MNALSRVWGLDAPAAPRDRENPSSLAQISGQLARSGGGGGADAAQGCERTHGAWLWPQGSGRAGFCADQKVVSLRAACGHHLQVEGRHAARLVLMGSCRHTHSTPTSRQSGTMRSSSKPIGQSSQSEESAAVRGQRRAQLEIDHTEPLAGVVNGRTAGRVFPFPRSPATTT